MLAEGQFEKIPENGVIGTLAFKENPERIVNTDTQRHCKEYSAQDLKYGDIDIASHCLHQSGCIIGKQSFIIIQDIGA